MRKKVHTFVKYWLKSQKVCGRGLDVGSYDVNGSARDLFKDYTGLDMREGPNVDVVANSHAMPFDAGAFDCVTCLEMLEHDTDPRVTISEIHRVLKPGGLLIITVPGIGFPKHDYPKDYWRFTVEGLKVLLADFKELNIEESKKAKGVFAAVVK